MQEKENAVFVVATANSIAKLPPEFLRKGRFDELFFVDLPNREERKNILQIHLTKRRKWKKNIITENLISLTEGYSGADLEAVVKDAVESVFVERAIKESDFTSESVRITTEDLEKSAKKIRKNSGAEKDKVQEMRENFRERGLQNASYVKK